MSRSGPVHGHIDYNPAMRRILALSLVLAAPVAAPASMEGGAVVPEGPHAATRAEELTLEQAVQRAEQRYRARAVKAQERREDGRRVYRIRLLSEDGRVFEITVDAATGRME